MRNRRRGMAMPFVLAILMMVAGMIAVISRTVMLTHLQQRHTVVAEQGYWKLRAGLEWIRNQQNIDWSEPVMWDVPAELRSSQTSEVLVFQQQKLEGKQLLQIQLYSQQSGHQQLISTQSFSGEGVL